MNKDDVIKALECCTKVGELQFCTDEGCPYSSVLDCIDALMQDALNILKAQQPHVMRLEEVRLLGKDAVVWYEYKGVFRQPRPRVVEFVFDEHITFTDGGNWSFSADCYGERWRLWISRPTDEQREAVKWK